MRQIPKIDIDEIKDILFGVIIALIIVIQLINKGFDFSFTLLFLFLFFLIFLPFFYRARSKSLNQLKGFNEKNKHLTYAILGVHMMGLDRDDLRGQLNYLRSVLRRRFKVEGQSKVISECLSSELDYIGTLKWFKNKGSENDAIELLDFLADLAFHNDLITRREMQFLYFTGKALGLERSFVQSVIGIREQHRRRSEEQEKAKTKTSSYRGKNYFKNKYLRVLGLTSNSDFEDVKKAYRSLARTLHPDRFHRKSEGEQQAAHERFTEINLAYDKLKEMMDV
jgi:DnaJ-domain-containing protein 1